jgi:glutamine amidotransferase-like uncharacterized protein
MVLLLPAVVLFIFVSSQSGFSQHFRYVLPAFPFVFVWISKVAAVAVRCPRKLGLLVAGFLTWSTVSSLCVYPHSMSYFNEVVGGPAHGHKYLLNSNSDWGQDAFHLRDWRRQHHEASPLNVISANSYASNLTESSDSLDEDSSEPRTPCRAFVLPRAAWEHSPMPGWFAVSMRRIHDADGDYSYFLRFRPSATVGYGFRIFHVTLPEANRLRHVLGLPLLPDDWRYGDASEATDQSTRAFVASIAEGAHHKEDARNIIRVALFRQTGRDENASSPLTRTLDTADDLRWSCVSADDIQSGLLDDYDVVLFPGGRGSEMARVLGDEGRLAVREFVSRGGGYVGICSGAFLATAKYDWSLGLVNAKTLTGTINVPGHGEKPMVARGVGNVEICLTELGRHMFGDYTDALKVRYSGGPVLSPAGVANLPQYALLAIYRTETWLYEPQRGTMVGTPAIVAAPFGQGRVVLFSPHPESRKGLRNFVTTAVRAVSP